MLIFWTTTSTPAVKSASNLTNDMDHKLIEDIIDIDPFFVKLGKMASNVDDAYFLQLWLDAKVLSLASYSAQDKIWSTNLKGLDSTVKLDLVKSDEDNLIPVIRLYKATAKDNHMLDLLIYSRTPNTRRSNSLRSTLPSTPKLRLLSFA